MTERRLIQRLENFAQRKNIYCIWLNMDPTYIPVVSTQDRVIFMNKNWKEKNKNEYALAYLIEGILHNTTSVSEIDKYVQYLLKEIKNDSIIVMD